MYDGRFSFVCGIGNNFELSCQQCTFGGLILFKTFAPLIDRLEVRSVNQTDPFINLLILVLFGN